MRRSRTDNRETKANGDGRRRTRARRQESKSRWREGTRERLGPVPGDRDHPLLRLQRSHGNQTVQRLMAEWSEPETRSEMRVGRPDDEYEREADRIAEQVMRMPEETAVQPVRVTQPAPRQTTPSPDSLLTREDEYRKVAANPKLQRDAAEPPSGTVPAEVHKVLRMPGRPLDPVTRGFMEERFGHDFSRVRVYTGTTAERSARAVNARAYTVGNDVIFDAGRFSPRTQEGRRLIAHELTHVVQQHGQDGGGGTQPGGVVQRQAEGTPTKGEREETPGKAVAPKKVGGQTEQLIANLLAGAGRSGYERARVDIAVTQGEIQPQQWSVLGSPAEKTTSSAGWATHAAASFMNLARVAKSQHPQIYTAEFRRRGSVWSMHSFALIATVRPKLPDDPDQRRSPAASTGDEAERIIEDVRGSRQLVLSTAAMLIAEQDPTRLENLVFSMGPFAIAGVTRLGRLQKMAKLGQISKIFGKTGRKVFGEVRFRGLVQNRALRDLTHNEIYAAFKTTPFTPTNHAIKQLKNIRTKNLGVETLNDVGRHLNKGVIQDANSGAVSIQYRNFGAIVNPGTGKIVTFRPL